jgi:O-antigen ligase
MLSFFSASTFLFWLPLTLLLAASTLNTKTPGFAWLLFMLAGLWAWWQSRRASDAPGQALEVAATLPEAPYLSLARIWLLTTLTALLLKTVPMLYWADPWEERHAELRLFLGALGLYGLCQLPLERLRRSYLNANYMAWVGTGLAVACFLAFWLLLTKGSIATPTNRIPWAAALSLSTCTLLTLAGVTTDSRQRSAWLAASFAGLLAVLISDTRGAYGLVLVWLMLALYLFNPKHTANVPRTRHKIALFFGGFLIFLAVLLPTQFLQKPLQRIQVGWTEFESYLVSPNKGANTSVGARLFIWQRSLESIKESPGIGYGRSGRMSLIRQWGDEASSPVVKSLGHLHNEYLHTLLDHGLWGLASLLSYSVGLVLMVRKLRATGDIKNKSLAAGLASVLFLHMSAALTNMNFAHNYYPTFLSLAVTLLVCAAAGLARQRSQADTRTVFGG